MKNNDVDYKTKCRSLFILTLSLYYNANIVIDDNFMNSIHSYVRDRLFYKQMSIDDANLLLYFKRFNYTFRAYETEETISNLYKELDIVTHYGNFSILYDEIKQKDVDKITFLAHDFIDYMNSFNEHKYTNIPM